MVPTRCARKYDPREALAMFEILKQINQTEPGKSARFSPRTRRRASASTT